MYKQFKIALVTFTVSSLGTLAQSVDPIVKASPYGDKSVWSYSGGALPWSIFKPNDFAELPVKFDGTGVRPVGQVSEPGVHPRMFFSESDLPALRRRIRETRAGREAWKNVLSYANAFKLTYDEKADYAKPDWMNGAFFIHGRVPLYLAAGYDRKRENFYEKLCAGEPLVKKDWPFYNLAAVEALRCIIEDDAPAAQKLACGLLNAIKVEQQKRSEKAGKDPAKQPKPGDPPKVDMDRVKAISLGMAYDFIWKWMTPEQREFIREELVLISAWNDNYGTFNAANTSRSNWATFSYWVFDLMALEGDPGFNDLKYRGLYRGWRNFMTTSYFDSGAIFEGEGKSLLGLDAVAAFDRVADKYHLAPLSWHPAIRRHFGNFTVSSVVPSQNGYVLFDVLGGMNAKSVCTPLDVVLAHYFYPEDRKIDFLYRLVVKDDYRDLPNVCTWFNNMVVISAIYATDYDPQNTPESLTLPNSFFCGQRAMMMTRSSWDQDATFLTMHVRGASGGHPYRDRNGIMLFAKGRTWVTIPWDGGQDQGWLCDTVQIDGREQHNTTPGRVVDYVDEPGATFMVGDAKYCWDWVWGSTSKNTEGKPLSKADVLENRVDTGAGWKLVEQSFNDFAYSKNPASFYARPLKFNEDWLATNGVVSAVTRQINQPVLKALRTAGLVRGKYPYVLVMDDVQRDAFPAR